MPTDNKEDTATIVEDHEDKTRTATKMTKTPASYTLWGKNTEQIV